MINNPLIVNGVSVPEIFRNRKRRASGVNMRLLAKLSPGESSFCIMAPNWCRAQSFRLSAKRMGIKILIRQWLDHEGSPTGEYAIFRIT